MQGKHKWIIGDFKWKTCILNSITTILFHKIIQRWKYPVVKSKIPQLLVGKRNNRWSPPTHYVSEYEGSCRWVCSEPPATNQGSVFCKCFRITNTICLIWGLCLASADSGFAVIAASETHRSTSYLSEHFHLKHINLFAVSESLLNNWVVLIEVTVLWSLY